MPEECLTTWRDAQPRLSQGDQTRVLLPLLVARELHDNDVPSETAERSRSSHILDSSDVEDRTNVSLTLFGAEYPCAKVKGTTRCS